MWADDLHEPLAVASSPAIVGGGSNGAVFSLLFTHRPHAAGPTKQDHVGDIIMTVLKGITWDDPRGWGPLSATLEQYRRTEAGQDFDIHWDVQALEGFESHSLSDLAESYDIINLDHPHIGDAVEQNCLLPLHEVDDVFIGPCLQSYTMSGHIWALPIDAACLVSATRTLPRLKSYRECLEQAARGVRLAASLRGVHALMAYLTLLSQAGHPIGPDRETGLPDMQHLAAAAADRRRLYRAMAPESLSWNPLEALAKLQNGDVDYLIFTFAYVSFQASGIRFCLNPSHDGSPSSGAVLGGTGLGVSRFCQSPEAGRDYAHYLAGAGIQCGLWPTHGGQPAHRDAWKSLAKRSSFYSSMTPAMERSYLRPRFAGWNELQSRAGVSINTWLQRDTPETDLAGRLTELWNAK